MGERCKIRWTINPNIDQNKNGTNSDFALFLYFEINSLFGDNEKYRDSNSCNAFTEKELDKSIESGIKTKNFPT
jgi:hypothetical protein